MMSFPVTASATTESPSTGANTAIKVFWGICWFFVLVIAIGLGWDRRWHTTHVFDTFYSPPHLFTYTMSALSAAFVAILTFVPGLRRWFGPTIRLFPFPFPVPGALFLTGAGFVTLAIAGLLDDRWHTSFGLDETGWSTPHAMIGWGLCLVSLGFIACRLALAAHRPISWAGMLMLSILLLLFTHAPFFGPFSGNVSQETVRAVATLPVLQAQPAAQHTFRIYDAWNLTHTNPMYLLLAAFWAGTMLLLLHHFDRRSWIFWTVVTGFTLLQTLDGLSTYLGFEKYFHTVFTLKSTVALPVPLLPAALIWRGLEALRVPRPWALGMAGLVLGILGSLVWDGGQGLIFFALIAAVLLPLGGVAGEAIERVLRRPSAGRHRYFVVIGIIVPLITGIIDLWLRTNTP